MPKNKEYISKVYQTLKEGVEGFDKTPEQFDSLMVNDPTYRQKVHATLKETVEGFDKDETTFDDALGVEKKKSNSASSGSSTVPATPTASGTKVAAKSVPFGSETAIPYSEPAKTITPPPGQVEVNKSDATTVAPPATVQEIDYTHKADPKRYAESIGEIITNAYHRGQAQGEEADILAVSKNQNPEDLKRLATLEGRKGFYPTSEEYAKFQSSTAGDALLQFVQNPVGIITELSLESLSALARHGSSRMAAAIGAGAAAGSVVPGVGTAAGAGTGAIVGMGLASLNLEYSASIMEALKDGGVDVTDAAQLKHAFEDETKMAEIREHALKKGVPVALFDMLSAGLAGRIVAKPAKTLLKKALQIGAETGVQGALGGAGELAGQVTAGETINPTAIISEMLGELGGGAGEVVSGAMYHKAKAGTLTPTDVVRSVIANPSNINDQVDIYEHSGAIEPEKAAEIKKMAADVLEVNSTVPKEVTDFDKRVESVQLILARKTIDQVIAEKQQELTTIDEAFRPLKEKEIKQLQIQREEANAKILALSKSKPSVEVKPVPEGAPEDIHDKTTTLPANGEGSKVEEAGTVQDGIGKKKEVPQQKQSIADEIKTENENIDLAIEGSMVDGEFEGVTTDELLEDKQLLKTDPVQYFGKHTSQMAEYAADKNVTGEDRATVEQLFKTYSDIFFKARGITPKMLNEASADMFGKKYDELSFQQKHEAINETDARIDILPEEQQAKNEGDNRTGEDNPATAKGEPALAVDGDVRKEPQAKDEAGKKEIVANLALNGLPVTKLEQKTAGLLTEEQSADLQKEIESNYITGASLKMFGQTNNDIRMNAFSYDQPLARKEVNGVDLRIAEGLIEGEPYSGKRTKTFLLYADKKIVGKFYSVDDAKAVVKYIEGHLVPPTALPSAKRNPRLEERRKSVSPEAKEKAEKAFAEADKKAQEEEDASPTLKDLKKQFAAAKTLVKKKEIQKQMAALKKQVKLQARENRRKAVRKKTNYTPETHEDYIENAAYGLSEEQTGYKPKTDVRGREVLNANGEKIYPDIPRMAYGKGRFLKKGGKDATDIAADLIMEEPMFEHFDEQELAQMIIDHALKHPGGVEQYIGRKHDATEAENRRYEEEAKYLEDQMQEDMTDWEAVNFDEAVHKIKSMTDAEYESMMKELDEAEISEEEFFDNVTNEQHYGEDTEETPPNKGGSTENPNKEGSRKNIQKGSFETELDKGIEDARAALKRAKQALSTKMVEFGNRAVGDLLGKPKSEGDLLDTGEVTEADARKALKPYEEAVEVAQRDLDEVMNPDMRTLAQDMDSRQEVMEGLDGDKAKLDEVLSPPKTEPVTAKPVADKADILPVRKIIQAIFKGANFADKKIEKQVVDAEDFVAAKVKQANTSQSEALRTIGQGVTAWYNGLPRNQTELMNKRHLNGNIAMAKETMSRNVAALRKLIDSDLNSMERVHEALDPDFYKETKGLLAGQSVKKVATYNDLNPAEKKLFEVLRAILDYTHNYNFAMGMIDVDTYNKFKGKYVPRMYEGFEVPTDVNEDLEKFNTYIEKKIDQSFFKQRKEVTDDMRNTVLKDPIYAAAKRMMQTEVNAAVLSYMEHINKDPLLVSEKPRLGFIKLGDKGYGPLNGKYVPNYIAEDVKGYFFANELFNKIYDVNKTYDKNKIRQFLKKYHTVFDPVVQLGNYSSNFVFAFVAGLDPITYASKLSEAKKIMKHKGEVFDMLLKEGIIGTDILGHDMLPLTPETLLAQQNQLSRFGKAVKGADEWATKMYQGTDNNAKVAAYLGFREYGLTQAEAIQRVYDSFQNYSTVGKIWDFASKTPVIGNAYVKFQADLQRIMKNAAFKRPLTTAMYMGMVYGLAEMASNLSGESDEEKKIREGRAFIPKIDFGLAQIPLTFKTPAGEVNLARFLSPFYLYDMGDKDTPIESFSKMLPYKVKYYDEVGKNVYSWLPLPTPDDVMWGVWVSALLTDKDFRGQSIKDPLSTRYRASGLTKFEQAANSIVYVMRSQFPYFDKMQDMYLAVTQGTDYYGRPKNGWQQLVSNLVKIQEFGPSQYKQTVINEGLNLDYKMKNLLTQQSEIVTTINDQKSKEYDLLMAGRITQAQFDKFVKTQNENEQKRQAEALIKIAATQKEMNEFAEKYQKYLH